MHYDLTNKLLKDFPELYRGHNRPLTESLMCFGFECDDGWFQLIYDLSADLMAIAAKAGDEPPEVTQVKEKFGGLRFYLSGYDDQLSERINQAEDLSHKTCEVCGKSGETRRGGWVRTLCDEHV